MGSIHVKYDEIASQTAELRNHISTEILGQADAEYRQIQALLNQVDGAAKTSLSAAMEKNREKTVAAAKTLDKLLSFMANSSKQIEANERSIADAFESSAIK